MRCVRGWTCCLFGLNTFVLWSVVGCGGGNGTSAPPAQQTVAATSTPAESPENEGDAASPGKRKFQPVKLGEASGTASTAGNEKQAESVLAAMQPLQTLLGKWNGTSRKAQIDEPVWIWDFKTNKSQPALTFRSEKNVYVREGRLTYLPSEQAYEFAYTTPEGEKRSLRGNFTKPVQDVAGDNSKKLQRTYKLTLQGAGEGNEQWQLAFEQLENDRYLLEVDRKRGAGSFQRVDTIHSQREGTSFALSDTDYGDKTCIISQGLGTSTVTYKGQSYYVCCSGCRAAFEEDPERWIAKWEERKKMKAAK